MEITDDPVDSSRVGGKVRIDIEIEYSIYLSFNT
jgi:hypothetical protein